MKRMRKKVLSQALSGWEVIIGREFPLLCVLFAMLVWFVQKGMLEEEKKCGAKEKEEKFHEANYWKSIFISIPLPSLSLHACLISSSPLLPSDTFHFQQPNAKKNSSINLSRCLYEKEGSSRKKKEEKKLYFSFAMLWGRNFLRYLFIDTSYLLGYRQYINYHCKISSVVQAQIHITFNLLSFVFFGISNFFSVIFNKAIIKNSIHLPRNDQKYDEIFFLPSLMLSFSQFIYFRLRRSKKNLIKKIFIIPSAYAVFVCPFWPRAYRHHIFWHNAQCQSLYVSDQL